MPGIGFVEKIGYVDHRRSKVDLFCQSVKPGVFRMKKNPKLNKRLFLTIIEKVIFGTGQIVCQG